MNMMNEMIGRLASKGQASGDGLDVEDVGPDVDEPSYDDDLGDTSGELPGDDDAADQGELSSEAEELEEESSEEGGDGDAGDGGEEGEEGPGGVAALGGVGAQGDACEGGDEEGGGEEAQAFG